MQHSQLLMRFPPFGLWATPCRVAQEQEALVALKANPTVRWEHEVRQFQGCPPRFSIVPASELTRFPSVFWAQLKDPAEEAQRMEAYRAMRRKRYAQSLDRRVPSRRDRSVADGTT